MKNIKNSSAIFFILLLIASSINCASQKHYKLRPVITEEDHKSIPKPKSEGLAFMRTHLKICLDVK